MTVFNKIGSPIAEELNIQTQSETIAVGTYGGSEGSGTLLTLSPGLLEVIKAFPKEETFAAMAEVRRCTDDTFYWVRAEGVIGNWWGHCSDPFIEAMKKKASELGYGYYWY